ncbi:MAG: TlpA family protein disulfide reductase [Acidobacteria bacterium]|nr:TlpA family protein disulfide reductase [Acidobacteriota bacterium]
MRLVFTAFFVVLLMSAAAIAQPANGSRDSAPRPPIPKTVYLDSDGNEISNNEFVDIRMANPNYPDRTLQRIRPDGTIEFRLQKIGQEGMQVQDFTVRTVEGKEISYEQLRGKVVVLNFWFIGCPICRAMTPNLNEFAARYADNNDVVFLAMTEDPAADVKKYLANNKFDYAQAADARDVLKTFAISGYPKNVVISKTGEIVYWRTTIKAWDKFASVVQAELDKQ